MNIERQCGVVLHLSSLPGPYGIGDMGPEAHRFVDFLVAAGHSVWQIMPLGPTGYGDSPYQGFSAFAGNPMLISPELLLEDGYLCPEDLEALPSFPSGEVDFGAVIDWKTQLLTKAFRRQQEQGAGWQVERFDRFRKAAGVQRWLPDYALFRALKDKHGGKEWAEWEPSVRGRDPAALDRARHELADDVARHEFWQYLFFTQWAQLKQHASLSGLRLLGDVPIFVAHDSADAWSQQHKFHFDDQGRPTVVAGVPPDYFSATGQLWGNPLYDWEAMEADGFRWWIDRFRTVFELVDIIRIDHFRGFEAYWEVPAHEKTAINGRWVKGPGTKLFAVLREALGDVAILAEDLGVITPPVEELRDRNGFPGMKVLQFAFGDDAENEYLPHNFPRRSVVYTGTHDNDTTLGWYRSVGEREHEGLRRYLGIENEAQVCWGMLRAAHASVADLSLAPLQDFLELGSEARMNTPGKSEKNWAWRFTWDQLGNEVARRMRELAEVYGRVPTQG